MTLTAKDFLWKNQMQCVRLIDPSGNNACRIDSQPVVGVRLPNGEWRIRRYGTNKLRLFPHGPFPTREACLVALRLLT